MNDFLYSSPSFSNGDVKAVKDVGLLMAGNGNKSYEVVLASSVRERVK